MDWLKATVVKVANLSSTARDGMFALYQANYSGAQQAVFERDLESKNFVVLLADEQGKIGGFSTLAVYEEIYDNSPIRVIYSGDTIIEQAYWGKNDFATTWLQLAGQLKAQNPNVPLFWLLIVKGHRTYRYLSLFSKTYYPRHKVRTPSTQQTLMNYLAKRQFGDSYDSETGLVCLPEPRSFLNENLAPIPEKDHRRPDTQFFLSKNPGYVRGDELLCLCKLEADNLRRHACEWFLQGMSP